MRFSISIPELPNRYKESLQYALDNKQRVYIQSDVDDERQQDRRHHCFRDRKLQVRCYIGLLYRPIGQNKDLIIIHSVK